MKPIISLWILVTSIIICASALVYASTTDSEYTDTRTLVKFNPQEKAFVLERMRRMLETLTSVQQALAKQNPDDVNDIVKQMLQFSRETRPKSLQDAMPVTFSQLSQQMNQNWRSLSKDKHSEASIQEKVITIMSTCNACHRTYKIE